MPVRNRDQLIEHMAESRVKWVLFWGHTPRQEGAIDASCLSQWYPAGFTIKGHRYPTAEHFMMAQKARLFGDRKQLEAILAAGHPGEAKKFGRLVKDFKGPIWQRHRMEIVVRANVAKFSQNQELGLFLTGTGQRVLVEASPQDLIWGIGYDAKDPKAIKPTEWKGLNLLGFALMEARAQLRAASAEQP
ncbi:MAG: NADAR family protein [Planctomycetota bacterium]|jgi:ribA/ribD-fused uncharacterized protein